MPPLEGDDEVTERERIKNLTQKKKQTIKESSGIVCTNKNGKYFMQTKKRNQTTKTL